MAKRYLAYRCALCGGFALSNDPVDLTAKQADALCSHVIQNQAFAGHPYLHQAPAHMLHSCADGSCGIAYFAGIQLKED